MEDSKRKGKEPENSTTTTLHISDDETPPASPNYPPPQQPSSSTAPSSSSDQELVHEIKSERLNLTTTSEGDDTGPTTQEIQAPSSPKISLSSIPPASRRPFFNPSTSGSGSLPAPHLQQSQMSTVTTEVTAVSSSSGTVFSHEQNLAAKLRLMKPTEREDFRITGHLGMKLRRKKRRREGNQSEAGRARFTRRRLGPSPLSQNQTPYQKVQQCLAQLKDYIKTLAACPDILEEPPQSGPDPKITTPLPQAMSSPSMPISLGPSPTTTTDSHAASSSASKAVVAPQAGCSSSAAILDTEGEWTMEDVIEILEEFLKRVPMTIGAQEMENGLWEIQTRLGVDPSPTWYALMCKSYEHMWESLSDYFDCAALDMSILFDDVLEKDPSSGSEASGAGPSSAPKLNRNIE